MRIVAVTVHYGNPEFTAQLLRSLELSRKIHKIVCVLHDDFPYRDRFSRVRYLQFENRGYAAGINRAFRDLIDSGSKAQTVLVMNPDIRILDEDIAALLAAHQTSGADCTFPTIREDDLLIHGYRFTALGTMRRVRKEAQFFPGTCFLLNVAAWEKTGGLAEQYFHYYEDVDFCLRLQRAGCRIHHAGDIVIEHIGKSGAHFPDTPLPRYAVRNHLLFLRQLGKLNPLSFANVSLRHLLYLFRWQRGWHGVPQWFHGIREFSRTRASRQ